MSMTISKPARRPPLALLATLVCAALLTSGCSSSGDKSCEAGACITAGKDAATADGAANTCTAGQEGKTEPKGPLCCVGGCGASVTSALPRICKSGIYKCEGPAPVLQKYCAYQPKSCKVLVACATTVGVGKTEDLQDNGKVPELCCYLNCDGEKAAYRVCRSGLKFECAAGYVPVSRCKDPMTACKGVIGRYRKNGNKIPADLL